MPDFIPAGDADFDLWSANFSTVLTATPTAYGLVAGDATAYATLNTAWHTAFLAATNPATRTSATIATKDTARAATEAKARQLAAVAQAYPAITNTLRTNIGITVPDPVITPIGAPTTKPVCNVENIGNLIHTIRIRDESTPLSNAKPFGAVAAEVYVAIGPTVPASIADATYFGLSTRVPSEISYDAGDIGKTAYIFTRWVNAKGERGPVSDVTTSTIAG